MIKKLSKKRRKMMKELKFIIKKYEETMKDDNNENLSKSVRKISS